MAMLADSVEVVIGVDTHKQTHSAAVVATATGQTEALASSHEAAIASSPHSTGVYISFKFPHRLRTYVAAT